MTPQNKPRVGTAVVVIVIKDNKVLLGRRTSSTGKGTWGLTGGKQEFGETWEQCAMRETKEESGVDICDIEYVTAVDAFMPEHGAHFAVIFMKASHKAGEPKICEPDKHELWDWHDWDSFPSPLFKPLDILYKSGYHPFR